MRQLPPLRGDVWRAYIPGQPSDPHQPRPVLVVSEDVRNRNRDDVIVVPIYSRGRPGPTRVPIRSGTGGLGHDSIVFCEGITTVDMEFLEEGPLGSRVPESILRRVVLAVRIALGDVPVQTE